MKEQLDLVNAGFSKVAPFYEAEDASNPIIYWARGLAREAVTERISAPASILEINAGTGADALWFAQKGYRVHATDIADGMLEFLLKKAGRFGDHELFSVQKISFTDLLNVERAPFDCVFSNFGGLNCIPDLSVLRPGLLYALKPGGMAVLVFMPPLCLWEVGYALRGNFRFAFRRFQRNATANIHGLKIQTYYHTPRKLIRSLGPEFHWVTQRSFSLLCPPMNMMRIYERFERFGPALMRIDEHLGRVPLLRSMGDFCIVVLRRASTAK